MRAANVGFGKLKCGGGRNSRKGQKADNSPSETGGTGRVKPEKQGEIITNGGGLEKANFRVD